MKKKIVSKKVAALKEAMAAEGKAQQKKEAAAVYTEVSLADIEKVLKRAFHGMKPKRKSYGGSYYYDLSISENVAVRVYTSVSVRTEVSRSKENAPMKVGLFSLKSDRKMEGGDLDIVKRTQNWRTTLQDRVEDKIELYHDKEDYWEHRATGKRPEEEQVEEPTPGPSPEVIRSERERAMDEDGEGDGPSDSSHREPRELDEMAAWIRCKNGDWGVAVVSADSQEGDSVKVKSQDGRVSTVVLGPFERENYGKRIFHKGKQIGGDRPQRSTGYGGGYDYRRRY